MAPLSMKNFVSPDISRGSWPTAFSFLTSHTLIAKQSNGFGVSKKYSEI